MKKKNLLHLTLLNDRVQRCDQFHMHRQTQTLIDGYGHQKKSAQIIFLQLF